MKAFGAVEPVDVEREVRGNVDEIREEQGVENTTCGMPGRIALFLSDAAKQRYEQSPLNGRDYLETSEATPWGLSRMMHLPAWQAEDVQASPGGEVIFRTATKDH